MNENIGRFVKIHTYDIARWS